MLNYHLVETSGWPLNKGVITVSPNAEKAHVVSTLLFSKLNDSSRYRVHLPFFFYRPSNPEASSPYQKSRGNHTLAINTERENNTTSIQFPEQKHNTTTMVKAIRVHEHGGPEVLKWEEVEVPDPKEGEIKLKQTAVGLNFLDVYMRRGVQNTAPPLPYIPGMEGAGVVTAVGPGVTSCKVGDVVAYASPEVGGYAQERILPADLAVPIPSFVDPVEAAAVIFKGLTAHVLLYKGFKVEPGHTVLVHAAAGGVGSLLCQWASAMGATVIGTVSTKEKAVQAKEDGCQHVILYKDEDFVERVMEITGGKGVEVVYDSVGKDTVTGSFACLKFRGTMVLCGTASGPPDPVPFDQLTPKSLYYTFSSVTYYTDIDRVALQVAAQDLFKAVGKGVLKVRVNHKYPLSQATQAHIDLESRKTTGSVVLIPDEE